MSDVKTTTMRLSEDTIKSFRTIAEQEGFTQEQCMAYLVDIFQMQSAKEIMGDRKKEIETFEDYIHKLMNLYMGSLEISINAEDKIKDKFSGDLESKNKLIIKGLEFGL